MTRVDGVLKNLRWLMLASVIACSDSGNNFGIEYQIPAGWEIYHSSSEIVRIRKRDVEADVDMSVHPLGAGSTYADFQSILRQYSHVTPPSQITETKEIIIDNAPGIRISFEGQRVDTGVSTAGVRYLLEHNSKAYVFVYLGAGDQIAASRREARAMIESITFSK